MKGGQEIIRATVTSGRGCGGTVICHRKGQQSFSESKFGPHLPPPNQKLLGSPLHNTSILKEAFVESYC